MIPTIVMQLKVNDGMPADLSHRELQALATTAGILIAQLMNEEIQISEGGINISIGFVDHDVTVESFSEGVE